MAVIVSVFCTLGILAALYAIYTLFGMYNMLIQVADVVNANVSVLEQLRDQQEAMLELEEPGKIGLVREEE
jgi:hypothetical protein